MFARGGTVRANASRRRSANFSRSLQPLEEPDRTAFMKAAAEAVEKLGGPQADGPGAVHRLRSLAPVVQPYFHPLVLTPAEQDGPRTERTAAAAVRASPAPSAHRAAAQARNLPTSRRSTPGARPPSPWLRRTRELRTRRSLSASLRSTRRPFRKPARSSAMRPSLRIKCWPRGISFAAAFREASLRKAALRP